MIISKMGLGYPGDKMDVEGSQVALKSFWSLKKGTRTLNFCSNEPSPKISLVRGFNVRMASHSIGLSVLAFSSISHDEMPTTTQFNSNSIYSISN